MSEMCVAPCSSGKQGQGAVRLGNTHGACLYSLEAMPPGCNQVHSGDAVAFKVAGAFLRLGSSYHLTQDCRRSARCASGVRQRTIVLPPCYISQAAQPV